MQRPNIHTRSRDLGREGIWPGLIVVLAVQNPEDSEEQIQDVEI